MRGTDRDGDRIGALGLDRIAGELKGIQTGADGIGDIVDRLLGEGRIIEIEELAVDAIVAVEARVFPFAGLEIEGLPIGIGFVGVHAEDRRGDGRADANQGGGA